MRDLDDIDRELVTRLLEDARTPYSELADAVGLSPPAVSDRIDRLQDLGIVERFTLELDRSRLAEGVRMAVTFEVTPGETETVRSALVEGPSVEHVFATADSRLFVVGIVPDGDVEGHFESVFETGAVESVDASPLVAADWQPGLGNATLGLECVECGNTVTSEGVSTTLDGDRYDFCCESCEARFEERYEDFREAA